ncbi:MAG: thioredoxin-like domain-containing protein [Planctomycetota bacterium]
MPARTTAVMLALLLACSAAITPATGQSTKPRLWKDASGKFEVRAELAGVDLKGNRVKLRKADGEEVIVPIAKLSSADRRFLREEMKRREAGEPPEESDDAVPAGDDLLASTKQFYEDLRTDEREAAKEMLTDDAKNGGGAAAVANLPKPDKRASAIKVGKPEQEGSTAAVPVAVKVSGRTVKTKLHFRRVEESWQVFGISAVIGGAENTINFESAAADAAQRENPLLALVGKPLPLTGLMQNGQPFDIEQMKGKLVLVDFWATWCAPCRKELVNVAENYQKYNDKGFEVVAVSIDREMNDLQQFLTEKPMPWVVLADKHPQNRESMAAKYGISSVPTLLLVDGQGKVVSANCRGARLGKEIEKALKTQKRVASRNATRTE